MVTIEEIKEQVHTTKFTSEIEIIEKWNENKNSELLFQLSNSIKEKIKNYSFSDITQENDSLEKLIQFLYLAAVNESSYSSFSKLSFKILIKEHYNKLADIYEKNGCIGAAFDSLIKSIDPFYEIDKGEVRIPNDFSVYIEGITMNIDNAIEIFLHHCAIYFKVIAELGNSLNEALQIYEASEHFVDYSDNNKSKIQYWCSAAMLHFKLKSRDIETIKERLFTFLRRETNPSIKLMIIESLLRNVSLDGYTQFQLFKEARKLKVLNEENVLKKSLKLWSNLLTSPPSSKKLIIDCRDLLDSINYYFEDPIQNRLQRTRKSWVLNEVIHQLLSRYWNNNLAFDMAVLWKTYDGTNMGGNINENQLIILAMPTIEPNKCWYLIKSYSEVKLLKYDLEISFSDFIEEKNKIESKWLAMLEEEDTHEPQLLGNPNVKRKTSESYEKNLQSIYRLDKLTEIIKKYEGIQEIQIFDLSSFNAPLQGYLNRELKGEINLSFFNTAELISPKRIEKALFWIDPDSQLFTSKAELNAFKYFAEKNNIEMNNIIIKYQDECSKAEFLKLYADSSFDLIWISAHGIANSNHPYLSSLEISLGEKLYLGELAEVNLENEYRRLLVLNMCETATSYTRYNSMDLLSVASVLTNSNQSVIAHHWPTSYLSSSSFGAIMFMYLSMGLRWSAALSKTQILLSRGREEIISEINTAYPENELEILGMIDRQESNELDLFVNWGSTAYFE